MDIVIAIQIIPEYSKEERRIPLTKKIMIIKEK
jgi:hypothetical protein